MASSEGQISLPEAIEYAPAGFKYMADVITIQNSVLQMISGQTHTAQGKKELSSYIIDKEKDDLLKLKDFYLKQEEVFFNKFENIKNYKQLFEKIDQWNASGAYRILKSQELIDFIQATVQQVSLVDLQSLLESITNNDMVLSDILIKAFDLDANEELTKIVKGIVGEGLVKGIKQTSGGRSTTLGLSINVDDASGIKEGYTFLKGKSKGITLFRKKGSNSIEFHFTQDFNSKSRDRFMTAVETEAKKQQENFTIDNTERNKVLRQIKEKIAEFINLPLDNINIEPIKSVIEDFIISSKEINLNRSTSVIRGALGEIYWTAFFRWLGLKTRPVGFSIQEEKTGAEIPVDIMIESLGAQVKNYTENNGIVSMNTHFDRKLNQQVDKNPTLANFLGLTGFHYLQVKDPIAFGRLWYSENYNLPQQNFSEDKNFSKYERVYKRFEPIDRNINTYFKAILDQLLGLNKQIQVENNDVLEENFDPGKPTFFIFEKEFFPTSFLVEQIYNQLDGKVSEELINFTIQDYRIDLTPFEVAPGERYGEHDTSKTVNIREKLSQSRITYHIDVNVNRLAQLLRNTIK